MKYRICKKCQKSKLLNEDNFNKRKDNRFKYICKECEENESDIVNFRYCSHCGEKLPLTNEFFFKEAKGFLSYCKKCYPLLNPIAKTRKCIECGIEYPLTIKYFRKNNGKRGIPYFSNKCNNCYRENRKLKYVDERLLARVNYRDNIKMQLFKRAKERATRDNIEFSIDIEDIIVPKFCPILGIELKVSVGKANDASPSLDKIDPKKGYVKGNIMVISRMANIMKAHASFEQLITFSKNILIYIKQVQYKSDKLLENPERKLDENN